MLKNKDNVDFSGSVVQSWTIYLSVVSQEETHINNFLSEFYD